MPDPDLPPVVLDEIYTAEVAKELPVLPHEWRQRLAKLGLDPAHIETLIDAQVEDGQANYLPLIEGLLDKTDKAKFLANWFVNLEIPNRRTRAITKSLPDAERHRLYMEVYQLLADRKLSSTNAKSLMLDILSSGQLPADIAAYAGNQGLMQVSDESALAGIVAKVLEDNAQAAADVQRGETKAIGYLVGQVMKLSEGKANPQLAQELIKRQLSIN